MGEKKTRRGQGGTKEMKGMMMMMMMTMNTQRQHEFGECPEKIHHDDNCK